MDEVFEKLKKDGKNNVDNLVKWIKDSKLIDATKEQEEKVVKMFKDVADKKNVELANFKDIIQKLAVDQKKNFDDMSKQLAEQGPRIINAAMAGVAAFKEALTGK